MLNKMIAIGTSVLTALLVVGVAWAATGDTTSPTVTNAGASTSTSSDTATSVTAITTESSTPTTLDDTTSSTNQTVTTIEDSTGTSAAGGATTSTTAGSTTSTSSGASTSTSFDDSKVAPPDGVSSYSIPGVGTVTIEVRGGSLHLQAISAPGWIYEVEKAESDRIEIEFESGEAEAEFEARIHHGGIEVRSEVDSD